MNAKPAGVGKAKSKPKPKEMMVAWRCSIEFHAWLQELCDSERSTPAVLFDQGIALVAKKLGFKPPPKR